MSNHDSVWHAVSTLSLDLMREQSAESALDLITRTLRQSIDCAGAAIWSVSGHQFDLKAADTSLTLPQYLPDYPEALDASKHYHPIISVPLRWNNEPVGLLAVLDVKPDRTPDPVEVELAHICAAHAAAVIAAHRLTQQSNRWQQALFEEHTRLLQIQTAIAHILEATDSLTGIIEAANTLGWQKVCLALLDKHAAVTDILWYGLSDEERVHYREHILPETVWQAFLQGDLEAQRINNLYFLPGGKSASWDAVDILFAPLQSGEHSLRGVIRVDDPINGARPTVETLRPLNILVSLCAYVLETVHQLEEAAQSAEALSEQVDELSIIHRADRELGEHLNVDRVMTLTLDWGLRRTHADTGVLALMTRDRQGLVPFVTLGYFDREILNYSEQHPLPLQSGVIERTILTGKTQIVKDIEAEGDHVPFIPQAQSLISVPLSMRGEVLGVIILAASATAAFDEDHDSSFLERLARRGAVALDNARLFRQSEQLADDMAVLYTASRTITSTLEHQEVLQRIAQAMAVTLECSSAFLADYHSDLQELKVRAVYQLGTAQNAEELLPATDEIIPLERYPAFTNGIEQRSTVILRAADPAIAPTDRQYLDDHNIYAMIISPLIAQGELIGLGVVIEGRHDRQFLDNDIFKVDTLASHASVALRQSLLFNEVRELEKLKSEMIRMASHDLRNPLSNVMGYVELMAYSLEESGITPSQQEFIESLRRSTTSMKSLIDDLLTLERIESQRDSEWQTFDINGLAYEVVESAQSSAALKHHKLTLERIPDASPVYANLTQLRQAMANLVDNAIKYTPPDGKIEVRLHYSNNRIQFQVQDSGYGISPERQTRLFERFYRAQEPNTSHIPGTGLGLSLVKTVVDRHGGQVIFTSEPGRGSTFGFWIPVTKNKKGNQ